MMTPEPNTQAVDQKTSHSVGVTVTTKTETTPVGQGLELNPLYFKTVPGILKLIQLLFGIICMACASPALDYARFFMFVAAVYFIITILLCFVYFFSFRSALPNVPWLLIELVATAVGVLLYIIATIVQLAMTTSRKYSFSLSYYNYYNSYVAAGVFGLFNTIAYGIGAYLLFVDWKASRPATTRPTPNGNA